MNSKKLITLLVLTTMLFAMVPFAPVAKADLVAINIDITNDDNGALVDSGEKGHDIQVEGDPGSVASGYEVMIYWDKIQSWDGTKGHLNSTEADDDGGFEVWFEVPEGDAGNHYLWFTATDQETKVSKTFKIIPDCDISTSSGLAGSKILVDLWGFDENEDTAILFMSEMYGGASRPRNGRNWDIGGPVDEVIGAISAAGAHNDLAVDITPAMVDNYLANTTLVWTFTHDSDWTDSVVTWDGGGTGADADWTTPSGNITSVDWDAVNGELDIVIAAGTYTSDPLTLTYYADLDWSDTENDVETYEDDEEKYDGTADNTLIEPGSFDLTIGTVTPTLISDDAAGNKDPNGNLWVLDDVGPTWKDVGSIDYVTGEWAIDLGGRTLADLSDGETMDLDYNYFDEIQDSFYVLTGSAVTDALGSLEDRRVTIPSSADEGQFYVVGFDGDANNATDDFEIGAVISLSIDEGPVGKKVEIDGEGFPPYTELEAHLMRNAAVVNPCHIIGADDGDDETNDDGEFEFEIIIPGAEKKDDDYEIRVRKKGGGVTASSDFEVTALATVTVEPDFGPQGSTVTVSGENFQNIKDKKVDITLETTASVWVADIEMDVKLDADGSFEVDVTVPTENDATYDIKVEDVDDDDGFFNIEDTVEFRIGTIMVLLSKDEAVVGDKIVLTGNGFTEDAEWNATFGDETLFEEEITSGAPNGGLLKTAGETPQFFVPQMQPGVYTILVWDVEAEITVETEFTISEYTVLDFELYDAPNEFNVSIEGWNWPEVVPVFNENDEIEFILWNESDEWEMDVLQYGPHATGAGADNPDDRDQNTAVLNATGFLNDAWWIVPDEDTLSKGTYWVNATIETENEQEYFMQFEFVIGDIHVYSAPRKATFRIGDTVSFKIQHTFGNDANQQIKGGDIKVYDPDGELYWDGDPLNTWSQVQTWYESPTSSQTASGNPMVLLDDAPLGTWSYKWREKDGDTIKEGSFNVEASAAEVIGEQIEDLNSAIDDLTSDISAVTDAVAGVQSNVNSAIAAANAAVEAANAAVQAVNAVAATAGDAATAAQQAADAASDAKDAASGLTTLVYGAIGASLVAALAAIVSLMQISRRIAG